MKYLRDEPLKKHTSFRIGGTADYFCVPHNYSDLVSAIKFAKEKNLPVSIMGAGSNLLALDRGFRGLVIKLAEGLNSIKFNSELVMVEAGVRLPLLVRKMAVKGLSGIEFLAGIPGTIGGAVIMNAGAWGKQLSRYIESVEVLDKNGERRRMKKKELRFGYRKSKLQKGDFIVTSVNLRLKKESRRVIYGRIREYLLKRSAAQPLGIPNAGCVFKNPKGKFAGKILEEAGCKGMRVGDAQVSGKHANFIVNLGEAEAKDVLRLMTKMQQAAKIKLEPEIKIMLKSNL